MGALLSCDSLVGDAVLNHRGEELGTVAHIVVDTANGNIAFAVVACGGVLGIGERLFAVPWAALTIDGERGCLVMNVEKSRLEAAPGFDKDHWPPMADAQWAAEVHDFYGVRYL